MNEIIFIFNFSAAELEFPKYQSSEKKFHAVWLLYKMGNSFKSGSPQHL